MGILDFISNATSNVEWSRAKKIVVSGPDIFGDYEIFVDANFNVAIFLPKSDRTMHILMGDIVRAHRWIKCDEAGQKIVDKTPPRDAFEWKINSDFILYRGKGFPPEEKVYRGQVVSADVFDGVINENWLNVKIREYVQMMSTGKPFL